MRGAVRNEEIWKRLRTPTQDPSTDLHAVEVALDAERARAPAHVVLQGAVHTPGRRGLVGAVEAKRLDAQVVRPVALNCEKRDYKGLHAFPSKYYKG